MDIHVVCMDGKHGIERPAGFDVTIHDLDSEELLPLAAARNKGFSEAHTDTVIFVDVDCIVSPTLFEHMIAAITETSVIAAYPLYLPTVPESGDFDTYKHDAVSHPVRRQLVAGEPIPHLQFWSIIFGMRKEAFERAGGFDETFTGYGAEDTDFAMSFHRAGLTQLFVNDYVLHQYHDKYDPPLNHFDAIIENATRYKNKWGELPMRSWLDAFAEMGLIAINNDETLHVLRHPTEQEIAASVSKHPY
jgi:GT2 family glycosyltransferase